MKIAKIHADLLDTMYDCANLICDIYEHDDFSEDLLKECDDDPRETMDLALQAIIQMNL